MVVVVIVIVLAVLIVSITRRLMEGAHRSRTVGQMREIGSAVAM